MLAVGFSESIVKIWTLVPQKLKAMKTADQLQEINIEADDVLVSSVFISSVKTKNRNSFRFA